MGFRINTNIAAMDAHQKATGTNRALDKSLASLASGLRLNSAADDASGLVIADSLRSQANSLGQAVRNANDAIGIIQTADKAMDEQIKILDTIKTKSIQAASDSQNADSRAAIQSDVNRLIEQLDNIAKTTSFNGQTLLAGTYTNKEFQVGAFSNQTVNTSIGNTQSLAIGNLTSQTDIAQVGNQETGTTSVEVAQGSTTLVLSTALAGVDPQGLAVGDTIRIGGVGDYSITNLTGLLSAGAVDAATITLDRGLETAILTGSTTISLVQTVAEDLGSMSTGTILTTGAAINVGSTDITGFSVGDQVEYTNSAGAVSTLTVVSVSGTAGVASGIIVFSGAAVASGGVLSVGSFSGMVDRASLGTDFATSDYVQYTVEGVELDGVQLTDASANGVAQTGLGRVADIINSTTSDTGIKAVATVEVNSNIRVAAGNTATDITINGETILSSGTSLLSSDSDNTLINAVNDKTALTGVSATLESDGTMTLTSDGRAMNVSGLSGVAGINDGVHAGSLELIKVGGGDIDVSASHFSDAGLTNAASGASNLDEVAGSNVLSDLVYGQVDDNNDGVINSSDQVGLLRTREGATLSMDITESAIKALDSSRADLGSVQNQLIVTVNNISVTAVNVKAAESQIRDVDFAAESANFSRLNILAQSGSYALSQANAVQQNVLRLLQ